MADPTTDKGPAASTASTAAPTSTPSTGTTSTTSTASTPARPATARQALERAAATPAVPSTATGAEATSPQPVSTDQGSTAAEATIQLGADGDDSWFEKVPEPRRSRVLQVHVDRALKEFRQKHGLPDDASPEAVQAAVELASMYRGDPIQFVRQLITEIRQNPELAQQLGDDDEGDDGDDPEPQPDLVATDAQGKPIRKAYSADRMAEREAWFERRLMRNIMGKLQPYTQWTEQARGAQELMQIRAESREEAASIAEEMRQNAPHFKDNEEHILTALRAIPKDRRLQIGARAALYEAYNRVMKEKVLPTLSHTAQQEAIEDQRRRAAAGQGEIAPTSTASVQVKERPRNTEQLAKHMERMAAAGGKR